MSRFGLVLLLLVVLIAIVTPVVVTSEAATDDTQIEAVQGLIGRLLPSHINLFNLSLIPSGSDGYDVFEIESLTSSNQIALRGNNGVSLASALNYYLKYYCFCQVTWGANQLNIPNPAPQVSPKIRIQTRFKYRYYMNTCTHGYSAAFWQWDRWEQEIDWMALNGINLPLMMTGQEKIFQMVYQGMGIEDLSDFFTGPAFLPWNRMGNLNGYAGPLPQDWIDHQFELATRIVARMRSLGMKPILPAFAGHVPPSFMKAYPQANVTQLGNWAGFPGTYFLDAADPLFQFIGKSVITTLIKMFNGTDHYYSLDPFNEEIPASNAPSYLAATAKNILSSLKSGDPDGIWVMQGWFLYNAASFWRPAQASALLGAIPREDLIMLDLWAEVNPVWDITETFYNHTFVWCMLHNFGERPLLYGDMESVAQNPALAMEKAGGAMQGLGLTPEGIQQNPIMYDMLTDQIWREDDGPITDITGWVQQYVHRRYGAQVAEAQQAWKLLQRSVYNVTNNQHGVSAPIIVARPSFSITGISSAPIAIPYNTLDVVEAWELLLSCSDELGSLDTYRYDLVTVTSQVLSNIALDMYQSMCNAYYANDIKTFSSESTAFLGLIKDMDSILATDVNFLLGVWTSRARSWAANNSSSSEVSLMESNARLQITTWAKPSINDGLLEYAYKLWSGLVGDFYLSRWSMFVDQVLSDMKAGRVFDPLAFSMRAAAYEQQWTSEVTPYPTEPTGDTVQVSEALYKKYAGDVKNRFYQKL